MLLSVTNYFRPEEKIIEYIFIIFQIECNILIIEKSLMRKEKENVLYREERGESCKGLFDILVHFILIHHCNF